ncbi:MAG: tripartite tricarboxylate transporter substrate binding protein [Deltaproteobacteria bacterium]|jgi:tripartite-type tricarboxylate transporter receptor subunit TctC|nr:tripartite tricarboxylate transporter substrate binding protein [Deltaproteobacteria bacterium]
MRRTLWVLGLLMLLCLVVAVGLAAAGEWKPTKPIRIIVPWGAGGSTDQAVRSIAGDLEGALGQKVVVVNQPGGGGAIGTKSVLDAPCDGYTWASGAVKDLGTYIITGTLNTKVQDWHIYLNTANATLVSVNPNAPIKDFREFLALMKKDPKRLSVAIAGIPSAGHSAIEAIKRANGGDYKLVSYDGGNPAVIATVGGETMATPQLLSEQIEMIRAKKLRPLAAMTPDDLVIEGFGTVPSATKWLPKVAADPIYFGIWVPKCVPKEVAETMNKVWREKVANSKSLKNFANLRGQIVSPYYGDEALKKAWPSIVSAAWGLYDGGKAKVKPDEVGMPRP